MYAVSFSFILITNEDSNYYSLELLELFLFDIERFQIIKLLNHNIKQLFYKFQWNNIHFFI